MVPKVKVFQRLQHALARYGVFLHQGTLPDDLATALEARKNYVVIGLPPRRRTDDE